MSKLYYNAVVNDVTLKITDKYIWYGNDIIPVSALSFVSVNKKKVRWWVPIVVLFAAAIILFIGIREPFFKESYTKIGSILFAIGLTLLIITIINSRKRYISLYSHSRERILIEMKEGDRKPLTEALFRILENEEKPIMTDNKTDHSRYMP